MNSRITVSSPLSGNAWRIEAAFERRSSLAAPTERASVLFVFDRVIRFVLDWIADHALRHARRHVALRFELSVDRVVVRRTFQGWILLRDSGLFHSLLKGRETERF